jgi:hypothetical protein
MSRLLTKDLKAVGLFWLGGLVVDVLFVTVFVEVNLAFLFVQVILTFLLGIVQPAVEDRFGVAPFLNSLPVRRGQVVVAQYLAAGLIVLCGLGVLVAVPTALHAIAPSAPVAPTVWLRPAGIAAFLVPIVLLEILFLPLYFRLGLGRAIWGFLVALLALGGVAGGLMKMLSILAGRPLSRIFPLDREVLVIPYKPFLPLAGKLKEALGAAGLAAAALAVLAGLVYLSLRLSMGFYERREF